MIDKESYDTWVKKQQEQKEKQVLQKKALQINKTKQGMAAKELGSKGSISITQHIQIAVWDQIYIQLFCKYFHPIVPQGVEIYGLKLSQLILLDYFIKNNLSKL